MALTDEERITENDKVLAVITNQYMLLQVLWYHSQYPEGKWDAIVIPFAHKNSNLIKNMPKKCIECGIFDKVYIYDSSLAELPIWKKVFFGGNYVFQYILHQREKSDRKWAESIIGKCDYRKIVIQSSYSVSARAMINAMPDRILVCLEDGMGDYNPAIQVWQVRYFSQIFWLMLAKLNIVGGLDHGYIFGLKYDNRIIKYCSLPDKMKYRGYKKIKQLFVMEDGSFYHEEYEKKLDESYDMVIFSTPFSDIGDDRCIYETLYTWLKEHYKDKKILIKPHPRETYQFLWDDLDVTVGMLDVSGETVLDMLPEAEVLFLYTTSILLKACREKRSFKIIRFDNFQHQRYFDGLKADSEVLGLKEDNWIVLGGITNDYRCES